MRLIARVIDVARVIQVSRWLHKVYIMDTMPLWHAPLAEHDTNHTTLHYTNKLMVRSCIPTHFNPCWESLHSSYFRTLKIKGYTKWHVLKRNEG